MKTSVPLRIAGIVAVSWAAIASPFSTRAGEAVDVRRFEKEVLVPASRDAIQMDLLANGDIVLAEFWGAVKRWDAKAGTVKTLGEIPCHAKGEVGLLGMAVARDFAKSGHIFFLFCPAAERGTMRVSRFTVTDGKLSAESERVLLSWPYDTEHVFHMGGAMFMDGKGDLYIGNGDNCHWNPGLPVDTRPDRKNWDAFRSAANSRDLRGKILRIHPTDDGRYTIPAGNLFADGKNGAPEVYAMGVRNPFRMTVDDATGTLYFGDVGPNVLPELGVTPVGYEEINATKEAGNFGWPLFIGPNEALPFYDFDAKREITRFDPQSPVNPSPRNAGIKNLPPAKPALIWYSTVPSKEFPTVGSGGRSIMAGPVYHFDPENPSTIKLPDSLDGHLFIYEWMRNWVQTVDLKAPGPVLEPFLPWMNFRRPIDMKLGADGALYLIEYGDQWWENKDSRIVRIVYRRGNRPPVARLAATETAGIPPLAVEFDASRSTDPDLDRLRYTWTIAGEPQPIDAARLKHTFDKPGSFEVAVSVRDSSGETSTAKQTIHVGNGRPIVRFETPANGSFFDWGQEIPYRVSVTEKDGDPVQPGLIAVQGELRSRRFTGESADTIDPGLAMMRSSTCFACHMANTPSAGPPYKAVALKYKDDAGALERLAQKVISGGSGVWGQLPMPPHPQHTAEQTRRMVEWVLSLKDDPSSPPQAGATGAFQAPSKPKGRKLEDGVLLLTASYTDDGRGGTFPRLTGEDTIVLRSRKMRAALFDENHGMAVVEQGDGESGIVGHFKNGDYIIFRDVNLTDIHEITLRAGSFGAQGGKFELRKGSPTGALIAAVEVKPTGDSEFLDLPAEFADASGKTSPAIVLRTLKLKKDSGPDSPAAAANAVKSEPPPSTGAIDLCIVASTTDRKALLGLNWIEFKP